MKLGLIGHPLGHSWSPQIHGFLIHEKYGKWDIEEKDLDDFFAKKDFDGINITIPYKQKAIPYMDEMDPAAKAIGAINCVVNRKGKLKGYNTDYLGFRNMLVANEFDPKGKVIAVLGTGGASKAVSKALEDMEGKVVHVSRKPKNEKQISYEDLYQRAEEFRWIVNATPVGMAPDTEKAPVDPGKFPHLEAVVDIIANPLCTKLAFDAKVRKIPYLGGFEMLVRQALAADEIFLDQKLDDDLVKPCMNALLKEKRNLVLIGMPTSGKSTIAKYLHEKTGLDVMEMDGEIEKELGTSIRQCFAEKGETYFRQKETELCAKLSKEEGKIISCGGGVIKKEENMRLLNHNGLIIWLKRDLSHLFATDSRPLTGDEAYMKRLYEERRGLYENYSDIQVDNNGRIETAVNEILKRTGWE